MGQHPSSQRMKKQNRSVCVGAVFTAYLKRRLPFTDNMRAYLQFSCVHFLLYVISTILSRPLGVCLEIKHVLQPLSKLYMKERIIKPYDDYRSSWIMLRHCLLNTLLLLLITPTTKHFYKYSKFFRLKI